MTFVNRLYLISLAMVVLCGCAKKGSPHANSDIAVSNSYLACAVKDICGPEKEVLCLAPPGMCPGHFDISPGRVNDLCKCRLLILFDFQSKIADQLERISDQGLQIKLVRPEGGLCVPANYLDICRQAAVFLTEHDPTAAPSYEARLIQIEKRLAALEKSIRSQITAAGLQNVAVVTSHHQGKFAEWLGFNVISQFTGGDTETAWDISQSIESARGNDIRFVIANRQEGTALAQALAERLDSVMVVFSNFPGTEDVAAFDLNLHRNIDSLMGTAR